MKKLSAILLILTLSLTMTACGNKNNSAGISNEVPKNSSYNFEVPDSFERRDSGVDTASKWVAKDLDNSNCEIITSDVGYISYVDETVPKTFEEYRDKELGEDSLAEKIHFNYSEYDNYEQFEVITKMTFAEGSPAYELKKAEVNTDNGGDIFEISATKIIVNKNDPSQCISMSITSNDINDVDLMQKTMDSFVWK